MTEIITLLLIRFTFLMGLACVGIFILNRAEPTWKITFCRAVFVSLLILLATFIVSPDWKLPFNYAAPSSSVSVSSSPATLIDSASFSSAHETSDFVSETLASPATPSYSWVYANGFMLFCFGWGLIAAVLISRQLYLLIRLSVNNRTAAPASHAIQQCWNDVCHEYKIRPTSVLVVSGNNSPHLSVTGKLVLPEALLDEDSNSRSMVHMFRHEASHLRSHDHYWFPVIAFLKNLFWFHPLVWLLESNHLQACENASDAEAARRGGTEKYRSSIAEIALRLLPLNSSSPALLRQGSSLLRRLESVKRSANQMPVRTRVSAATYGVLLLVGVLFGGVVLVPVTARDKDEIALNQTSRLEGKLSEIIIPSLEFQNTSIDDALAYLKKRSVELDVAEPDRTKKGVNFILDLGGSKNAKNTKISLKLSNVPLATALKYTVALAQLKYGVEPHAVRISPMGTSSKSAASKPVTGKSANQYIDNKLKGIIIPSIEFRDTPLKDALAFLQKRSVELDLVEPDSTKKGVNFILQNSGGGDEEARITLKLKNVPLITAVKYTTALAQLKYEVEPHAVRILPLDTASNSAANKPANQDIDSKLKSIIIPSVEFRGTPLKEALAFLQKRSVELDQVEPDSSKKGVNFILQNSGGGDAEAPVTLKLNNVPLITAVKYTTALAQFNYKVGEYALIIYPLNQKAQTSGAAAGNDSAGTVKGNGSILGKTGLITTGQQGYIIEFAAMPDKQRFQIIRHPSENYGRATFILREGEKSPDGKFRINGYKKNRGTNSLGIMVDTSELEITQLESGDSFNLQKRIKKVISN